MKFKLSRKKYNKDKIPPLTEEQKNKEKRKNTPLTKEEYLTFFFFPYTKTTRRSFTKNFNESEDERFIKHGFDTKTQQVRSVRTLGFIFYGILLFVLIILIKHFNLA